MENADTTPQNNVVNLKPAPTQDAPNGADHPTPAQVPDPETPKEPSEKEKANQEIIESATKSFVDLKTAVMNITNVHNCLAQATHHGTQVKNVADAQRFLEEMWKPLRKQLDDHPMFKAEQAEQVRLRDEAIAAQVAAQAKDKSNGQAPEVQ